MTSQLVIFLTTTGAEVGNNNNFSSESLVACGGLNKVKCLYDLRLEFETILTFFFMHYYSFYICKNQWTKHGKGIGWEPIQSLLPCHVNHCQDLIVKGSIVFI